MKSMANNTVSRFLPSRYGSIYLARLNVHPVADADLLLNRPVFKGEALF
tara:strand:+ start:491 stop:637 length:147 start_codon:yes stop_codon:yes gene_type:complete